MKKEKKEKNSAKTLVITAVVLLLMTILLFPVKVRYKDGGTVRYQAITYSVTIFHKLTVIQGVFEEGVEIKIFGLPVYKNVRYGGNVMINKIHTDAAPAAIGPYSQAMEVEVVAER